MAEININDHHILKERFEFDVTQATETVSKEFEIDNKAVKIVGIAITSDRDELLFYRGSHKILINDQEIFPEGYESKRLVTGLNIEPDKRFANIGELDAGNRQLQINYLDSNHVLAAFTPYKVRIYVYSQIG